MRRACVLFVIACGGSPPRAPAGWSLPADPTLGLCAAGQTAVTGPAALLDAAAEALRRGCPREALLDAQAVLATGDPRQRAAAQLLQIEASQDARANALLGEAAAAEVLQEPAWLAATPVRDLDAVGRLASAVGDGTLDPAARDDGRLLRAVVRFAPQLQCLPTVAIQADVAADHEKLVEGAIQRSGDHLMPGRTGGGLAAAAISALWRCELSIAAQRFDEAAAAERRAGRGASAFSLQLQAWQARELPGGRAAVLGSGYPAPLDALLAHARDLEAAPHGGGTAELATRAAAALDRLVAEAGVDGAGDPEVLWLRAVLAQRFAARPREAFELAARAEAQALLRRRADLVDAARFVGALAAIELDRAEDARRLLALTFASVERRGRWGTLRWLANATQVLSAELVRRGQPGAAMALVEGARAALGNRSYELGLMLASVVARTLQEQGRLEDAFAEFDRLGKLPPGSLMTNAVRELSAVRADELREALGLGGTPAPANPPPVVRAQLALRQGDLGPLRALLATPFDAGQLVLTDHLCAAAARSITPAVGDLVRGLAVMRTGDHLKGLKGRELEQASLTYSTMLMDLHPFAEPIMRCAATLHDPVMFGAAHELATAIFGANEHAEAYEAEARGQLERAAALWEELGRKRAGAIDELGGVTTAQASGDAFERAALAYLASGRRVERAVELLEESRARSLRAARASTRKDLQHPALAPLAELERQLAAKTRRVRALVELARGTDPTTRAALAKASAASEAELAALEARRDQLARGLRASDPRAYRAAALSPPPSVPELQRSLARDEVMVFFVVHTLEAYAIVVDRSQVRAIPLASREPDGLPRLVPLLQRYRTAIRQLTSGRALRRVDAATPPGTELAVTRRELYELLVAPLERHVPRDARVIVIPDGATAELAFAELGEPERPWIERNPIRVLPSARLVLDPASAALEPRRALVVGDPDFRGAALSADQPPWPALPGTRREATAISSLLGVTPVLGLQANEPALLAAMPRASLIHLATHGLADVARPASSLVVLSHASSAPQDGLLHAYEIERLRLEARLVVLSACETGRGQARGSEGVLALDRAFLVAGAGAVISSLWVVPDEATSALMAELYQQLRAKAPVDVALARAMRAIRRQPRWADPLYWAAFRVVGAGLR